MIQIIIVSIVILAAVFYASYLIVQAIKNANDPCSGCAGCALHDQLIKKRKDGM
ncbi:MAG TPA: FeoB-associated Cys-rich membrane protein, partial [Xylanibacter oryzae]|nr:FeoB-associated Cys-rich membrane protein [Xylanibacter oryzae]